MTTFELRVAITAADFDKLVAFYCDGLGLDPGDMWTNNGQGQLFNAGQGVIEILDHTHSAWVDNIEVGRQVSGQIRFAFHVEDIQVAMTNALDYGATLLHDPVLTPWGDLNVRLKSPDGLQITLYQTNASEAK